MDLALYAQARAPGHTFGSAAEDEARIPQVGDIIHVDYAITIGAYNGTEYVLPADYNSRLRWVIVFVLGVPDCPIAAIRNFLTAPHADEVLTADSSELLIYKRHNWHIPMSLVPADLLTTIGDTRYINITWDGAKTYLTNKAQARLILDTDLPV